MGKIILDTNIHVAALGWNGTPRKVVISTLKEHELVTPLAQLEELRKVLPRLFSEEIVASYTSFLETNATITNTPRTLRRVKHEVDNVLLEAALLEGVEYLITGDEELLKVKRYGSVVICSPKEYIRMKA